jgi:hypothetical protein
MNTLTIDLKGLSEAARHLASCAESASRQPKLEADHIKAVELAAKAVIRRNAEILNAVKSVNHD